MMKKHLLLILCLLSATLGVSGQHYQRTCYFGFTFEVSNNPRWGYGEPVITSIDPYSNAAKAGLKTGDIIMEVNGQATYLRHAELIDSWLFDDTAQEVSFTIRNLNNTFKEVRVARYCQDVDAVNEEELAEWFSLYSVEGNCRRSFELPLEINAHAEADFSDYYTFDFIFPKNKPTELDDYMAHQITKKLNARGLKRDVNDPDILIQIYYSYTPNKNYRPDPDNEWKLGEWRYDLDQSKMEHVPVITDGTPFNSPSVKGQVVFGFQFLEKKYISPGQTTQIWDASLRENITGDYSLEDYCRMHVPLMMTAYPYKMPAGGLKFTVDLKDYLYTGANFNRKDLSILESMDEHSPAYLAGLRQGDRVLSVNGIAFPRSDADAKRLYADFVAETMPLRDATGEFINERTNAPSFPWNSADYKNIAREFKKTKYAAGFSYLFAYENFIGGKSKDELTFKVDRRGHTLTFRVRAERRKAEVVTE